MDGKTRCLWNCIAWSGDIDAEKGFAHKRELNYLDWLGGTFRSHYTILLKIIEQEAFYNIGSQRYSAPTKIITCNQRFSGTSKHEHCANPFGVDMAKLLISTYSQNLLTQKLTRDLGICTV